MSAPRQPPYHYWRGGLWWTPAGWWVHRGRSIVSATLGRVNLYVWLFGVRITQVAQERGGLWRCNDLLLWQRMPRAIADREGHLPAKYTSHEVLREMVLSCPDCQDALDERGA